MSDYTGPERRGKNRPWASRTAPPTPSRVYETMTLAEREAAHLQVLADSLHITVEQLIQMGNDARRRHRRQAFNAA
jgi:hypothetical protein